MFNQTHEYNKKISHISGMWEGVIADIFPTQGPIYGD